jgi:hypothetical protein
VQRAKALLSTFILSLSKDEGSGTDVETSALVAR